MKIKTLLIRFVSFFYKPNFQVPYIDPYRTLTYEEYRNRQELSDLAIPVKSSSGNNPGAAPAAFVLNSPKNSPVDAGCLVLN
ncbi:hypothetical protein [Flavobacterium rhizosphaerae]|uniref:Uncharacterized protein n=1 Tax=Flavobacterium rhizosphaerae TaxID=3163298 RepID=A0ABW8YXT6_9FLAO